MAPKKKLVSVDFTKKAVILTQWAKSPKKQSVGVYVFWVLN